MASSKIICLGSPFGDDQFGAWAYQELSRLIDFSGVELIYLDRPGMRLIPLLEGVEQLILVDSVKSGAVPGAVLRMEGADICRYVARHTSTHGFGLAEAMALAERLGYLPRSVILLGVEAGATDAAAHLSAAVRASLPVLLEALNEACSAFTPPDAGLVAGRDAGITECDTQKP